MTELERILKESLTHTEQLLRHSQEVHSQTLQQHSAEFTEIKSVISTLQAEQATQKDYLTEHLTRLNAVYENLQPLLMRLNALLPGK